MNHKSGTENERRAKVLLFFVQLSEKYRASNNRFQEAKKIMPIYINDNTTPGWYEMFRTLLYDTRELDLNSISTKLKALKKPTKLEEKNLLFSQQILNELTRDGAQPRRGEIGEEDIEFPFVKMNIKPGKINEASKYFNEHPEPIEE